MRSVGVPPAGWRTEDDTGAGEAGVGGQAGCETGQAVVEHQVLVVRVQQGNSRLSHSYHRAGGNHLREKHSFIKTKNPEVFSH